jgi:hypothetical protein
MSKQKGRRYSYIYSKLVTDPNGLTGVIAYCLYKQEKIAWIEDFKKSHNDIPPTDKEIENNFSKKREHEYYLNGLMSKADEKKEDLLNAWGLQHENEKQQLLKENCLLKKQIIEPLEDYLKPTWVNRFKNWGKDILFSFISVPLWIFVIYLITCLSSPLKMFLVNTLKEWIKTLE